MRRVEFITSTKTCPLSIFLGKKLHLKNVRSLKIEYIFTCTRDGAISNVFGCGTKLKETTLVVSLIAEKQEIIDFFLNI